MNSQEYERVTSKLDEMHKDISEIKLHMQGIPGDKDNPGLLTRLSVLETKETNRSRLEWAGLIALVGLVVKAAWDVVTSQ